MKSPLGLSLLVTRCLVLAVGEWLEGNSLPGDTSCSCWSWSCEISFSAMTSSVIDGVYRGFIDIERKVKAMENQKDSSKDNQKERDRAIGTVLGEIEKQFGKGAIMRLGEGDSARPEAGVVSTGSLGLDIALGTGGLPRGRIVEVYGPESSGKTTLALHVLAEAQRAGGTCAFIDAEHALDVGYARKLGVRTEDLLLSQPDHGEQALEITDMLVRSEAVDVIVIDSVAALVPKAELEGEMGDAHMGLQARLMSQALRKLTGATARGNCMVIFINQLRMKIGVMFGNPETTTGGNALKFYASVRLDVRRIGALKDGEQVVGNRTRVKVVKNKMAAPFRETEFDVAYGQGISRVGEIIDLGVEAGLLEKSGAWIAYGGERLGNGRDAARQHLLERQDLLKEIRGKLLAHAGIGATSAAPATPPATATPAQADERRPAVRKVA
jgi:recombination protein RecA